MRKQLFNENLKSVSAGHTHHPKAHDSAHLHVTGEALFIDDKPELNGQLHLALGLSPHAHAKIKSINLEKVLAAPGVVTVITHNDIPGDSDIGAVFEGDPLLAVDTVSFAGQAVFAVAAESFRAAKEAVALAEIEYEQLAPALDFRKGIEEKDYLRPDHVIRRGDVQAAIKAAPHQIEGEIYNNGQEHFYLEGQIASVVPTEDGQYHVYVSSQNPTEVQRFVAKVLGLPLNKVVADVRRMGGGFGGKETNAFIPACLSAVASYHTGRPAKCRIPRQDDFLLTGKRHPFLSQYKIGFDDQGKLRGVQADISANGGYSTDMTEAIVDRALLHADNAYYYDTAHIAGHHIRTNLASNTAFRGFGGPQGILVAEQVQDEIARHLNLDPLEVRKRNFYQIEERNEAPYGQKVEHNILGEMVERLEQTSDYQNRRSEITEFNRTSPIMKKGLALTPLKFGISFTVTFLNQAGALLVVYTDGTMMINHGGTEMGQGLHTKIAQIVAETLGVGVNKVQVTSTRTDKVPNSSPTAASSGADLNGQAAHDAARKIRQRLVDFACKQYAVRPETVTFQNDEVLVGSQRFSFADLVGQAYMARIPLSATGYYQTPKVGYDRAKGHGQPFFYYVYGAAVSEVQIDTLTGEYKLLRADILHDVGRSLNQAIDIGQIEGAFIQGTGWLTSEELVWDDQGHLLSNGPATYKIPTIADIPPVFNVELMPHANPEETVYHSKAVGEPPFMLAISVWSAIRDAIASVVDYQANPKLAIPATPEAILTAVNNMRERS